VDVLSLVERLRSDARFAPNVVHWEAIPGSEGSFEAFPAWLHPRVERALRDRGIERLYRHQRQAVDAVEGGEDVLVATPTASGKSLCYNLPVLDAVLRSHEGGEPARALYLFPTKALSQDQIAEVARLVEALGIDASAFTYDGDTPPAIRRRLRERGEIVATNPYMLHTGILPHHTKWIDFFRHLKFVVVDEVHSFSGVFGSHVANVLRRLRRVAAHYGSRPVFLGSSATIGNPAEHGRRLLGGPVRVVDRDDAPRGDRYLALYNPPLLQPVAGLRASVVEEARRLASLLVGDDHQTIFFARTRSTTEVLVRYLKEAARAAGADPEKVRSYRGGYLPDLRRAVERDLRSGAVTTVVSTNALELGIDLGGLDVAVLVGYPGSVASFFQQAGRAGRRGKPCLALMLCRATPDDQYLSANPGYLFGGSRQKVAIDPDNVVVLAQHLKCAAFELPFRAGDGFGDAPEDVVSATLDYFAEEGGLLFRDGDAVHWMSATYPAEDVHLDASEMDNVVLVDAETGKAIAETDRPSAIAQFYEGAVVGVQGENWVVERFDVEGKRATARAATTDYFTEAQLSTEIRVLDLGRAREGRSAILHLARVHATTTVPMFKKIRYYTRESVGAGEVHLPPEEMDTDALLLLLAPEEASRLRLAVGRRAAAWSGFGDLLRFAATLFVRCEPGDLGVVAEVLSPRFERPTLTLYDRHPNGVGLAEAAWEAAEEVLAAARTILERCPCVRGCPACVGPPEQVGPEGKEVALSIARTLSEDAWAL